MTLYLIIMVDTGSSDSKIVRKLDENMAFMRMAFTSINERLERLEKIVLQRTSAPSAPASDQPHYRPKMPVMSFEELEELEAELMNEESAKQMVSVYWFMLWLWLVMFMFFGYVYVLFMFCRCRLFCSSRSEVRTTRKPSGASRRFVLGRPSRWHIRGTASEARNR